MVRILTKLKAATNLPLPLARRIAPALLLLAFFFALAAGLQRLSGAYGAELDGYPDEPAHFVNGVVVKDYLTSFSPPSPIRFAEEFYMHRPKVALGHWPPVLYMIEALWFLLFGVSRTAALALMALISASLAASVACVIARKHGVWIGAAGGLLLLCLSVTQTQTSQVMADTLVALFGFWAAVTFSTFLSTGTRRSIVLFAIFALLTIFTKNSGLFVAFIPPVSMLLTNRLDLLRNRRLWLGALIAAPPSILWVVWTYRFAVLVYAPTFGFFLAAWAWYAYFLYMALRPALLVLLAAGIWRALVPPRKREDPLPLTLLASAICVVGFEAVAPTASIETRFLPPAIACLMPLLIAGAMWLAGAIHLRAIPLQGRALAILLAAAILSPHATFAIPRKQHRGFSEVADYIAARPDLRRGATLVTSSTDGEGLLISECVMRYPAGEGYILRGSKVLSHSDWMGRDYQSRFQSQSEVFDYLNRIGVDFLVIDRSASSPAPLHQQLLLSMVQAHPGAWQPLAGVTGNGDILLFRRLGATPDSGAQLKTELEQIVRSRLEGH